MSQALRIGAGAGASIRPQYNLNAALGFAAELGYSGYEYLKQSFGMWAPKGTTARAVAYINNVMKQAAEDPACQEELKAAGFAAAYMTVEDYTSFMADTYAKFQEAAAGLAG